MNRLKQRGVSVVQQLREAEHSKNTEKRSCKRRKERRSTEVKALGDASAPGPASKERGADVYHLYTCQELQGCITRLAPLPWTSVIAHIYYGGMYDSQRKELQASGIGMWAL